MASFYGDGMCELDAHIDMLDLHMECRDQCRSSVISQYLERHPEALAQIDKDGYLPLHALLFNISSSRALALMMIEQYPAALKHQDNHDGELPLHIECIMKCRSSIISKCIELYPEALSREDLYRCLPLHRLITNHRSSIEDALMMIEKYPAALQQQNTYDHLPLHIECKYRCRLPIISKCIELYPEALLSAGSYGYLPLHVLLLNGASSIDVALMMIEKAPAALAHHDICNSFPLHSECMRQCRAIIISKCIELYPKALDNKAINIVMTKINTRYHIYHKYESALLVVFTHCPMGLYDRDNYLLNDIREEPTYRRRILRLLPRHVFTPTHESDYRDLNWQSRAAMMMLLSKVKIQQLQSW
jgi:ankyrin repeat protein